MTARGMSGIFLSLLGVVVCSAAGGVAGYAAIRLLELSGAWGAFVAAAVAMVIATAAWAGGATLLRALGRSR